MSDTYKKARKSAFAIRKRYPQIRKVIHTSVNGRFKMLFHSNLVMYFSINSLWTTYCKFYVDAIGRPDVEVVGHVTATKTHVNFRAL